METLANNKNKTINAENATFFAQFQKCNDNCTTIKSMKYQKLINHIVTLKLLMFCMKFMYNIVWIIKSLPQKSTPNRIIPKIELIKAVLNLGLSVKTYLSKVHRMQKLPLFCQGTFRREEMNEMKNEC